MSLKLGYDFVESAEKEVLQPLFIPCSKFVPESRLMLRELVWHSRHYACHSTVATTSLAEDGGCQQCLLHSVIGWVEHATLFQLFI